MINHASCMQQSSFNIVIRHSSGVHQSLFIYPSAFSIHHPSNQTNEYKTRTIRHLIASRGPPPPAMEFIRTTDNELNETHNTLQKNFAWQHNSMNENSLEQQWKAIHQSSTLRITYVYNHEQSINAQEINVVNEQQEQHQQKHIRTW